MEMALLVVITGVSFLSLIILAVHMVVQHAGDGEGTPMFPFSLLEPPKMPPVPKPPDVPEPSARLAEETVLWGEYRFLTKQVEKLGQVVIGLGNSQASISTRLDSMSERISNSHCILDDRIGALGGAVDKLREGIERGKSFGADLAVRVNSIRYDLAEAQRVLADEILARVQADKAK